MLQLKNITKTYKTAGFEQTALDGLSVTFRENEFAAILGPSGSGKTTLLNIIGGLDHADSGDLVIEGISTQYYKDRDWDTYRNNRIGFVFQTYNLIPHQTVLANVELALTLSGAPKAERQERAKKVLAEVGLAEHINKKPNQLSGGQMQRVAIARALVNDPEILLADEPTGALDSKTSLQIMEILKNIADDRLVIMVTHNASLAETYATRTISLSDGHIVDDSDPYAAPSHLADVVNAVKRTSMSFLTSLSLSFSNLMTKKGRTIMTAFAGSIGIIGIAAILALANGVNEYIRGVEESTLSQYPLSISRSGIDLTSLMVGSGMANPDDQSSSTNSEGTVEPEPPREGAVREMAVMARMFQTITTNDLEALKVFLDDKDNEIWQYVNAIEYSYDLTPQIFLGDTSNKVYQVNPDIMTRLMDSTSASMGSASSALSFGFSMTIFNQLPRETSLVKDQYQVLAGKWPESYNECVVVLSPWGSIDDYSMYILGLRDPELLQSMIDDFMNQKDVKPTIERKVYDYQEILDVDLRLVLPTDYYSYDRTYGVYVDHRDDQSYMRNVVNHAEKLEIVGIIMPAEDSTLTPLRTGVNYSAELIDYLIEQAGQSDIVRSQRNRPTVDVFTGKTFEQLNNESRVADFDMSKMLSIDTDSINDAFTFDSSAFDTGSLGSIDFSGALSNNDLLGNMPTMPAMDMSSLFTGIDLGSLPLAGIMDFAISVFSDYVTERLPDAEVAADDLVADFSEYLQSDETQDYLTEFIPMAINIEGLSELGVLVITDFLDYCTQNGIPVTDMNAVMTAFPDWLANTTVTDNIGLAIGSLVDNDALMFVASQLVGNFLAGSGITVEGLVEDVGADFSEWMSDPAVNAQVMGYFAANVDLSPMIAQLTSGLGMYLQQYMESFMLSFMGALESTISTGMSNVMSQLTDSLSTAMGFDASIFQDAFQFNMTQEDLAQLMMSLMGTQQKTYEANLKMLGYANADEPSSISIYPKDFESKQEVIRVLDDYNQRMRDNNDEDKVVVYTDIVGALMSSVTDIIDTIGLVLVAFVSISLVVSSIMIGIVTYISVLERKKEIGILRSIGASKRDIGNVFNAETLIIGFTAGLIGIVTTALLCIPANVIIENITDVPNVALLPMVPALVLIGISCLLSFVAGLIPSAAASRRDPVEALRSE